MDRLDLLKEMSKFYDELRTYSGDALRERAQGLYPGDVFTRYGDESNQYVVTHVDKSAKTWCLRLTKDGKLDETTAGYFPIPETLTKVGTIADYDFKLRRIEELEQELEQLREEVGG